MLLRGDHQSINDLLRSMSKERKQIEKDISMLVFYMQGGLSYKDAYLLSNEQIELLYKTISEHYEKQNSAITGGRKSL
jgi:hypothetical protein